MDFLRRWWWVLLLVILVGLLAWCRPWRQGGQTSEESSGTDPKAQTNLEIEMYGGFAYVRPPEDNTLEVAYLRSWEEQPAAGVAAAPGDLCKVEQMGVDLMVYSGTIVEPAVPPDTKTFQVAGTVVTFPALASSGKPLIAKRSARPTAPPFGPDDHKDPAQWHDLKWVPEDQCGAWQQSESGLAQYRRWPDGGARWDVHRAPPVRRGGRGFHL